MTRRTGGDASTDAIKAAVQKRAQFRLACQNDLQLLFRVRFEIQQQPDFFQQFATWVGDARTATHGWDEAVTAVVGSVMLTMFVTLYPSFMQYMGGTFKGMMPLYALVFVGTTALSRRFRGALAQQ